MLIFLVIKNIHPGPTTVYICGLFGSDLNLAVWQISIGPPNLNSGILKSVQAWDSIVLAQHLA